ncbi:MAG TPA: SUMF1/EgtB/PvdO family nonheme iron enzyme [Anaerolineae bacterium]
MLKSSRSGGVNARAKQIRVRGDVIGRDKLAAGRDLTINIGQAAGALKKPAKPIKKLWHTYCDAIVQQHRYLNLQGVGADPNLRVELESVYVSLKTNERSASDRDETNRAARRAFDPERALTAMQMAIRKERLVLVGDPGSGKSTFLSHLALRFAEAWDKDQKSILKKVFDWGLGLRVPIYVPLRSFNAALGARSQAEAAEYPAALLFDYVMRQLDHLKVPDLKPHLEAALEDGRCLLLLDGLDEVPTDAQRKGVREAVENFTARYPNRAIVTCRTYAYHDASVLGGEFYKVELQPFDRGEQAQFVGAWYGALADQLAGASPQRRASDLIGKIRASARLPELASNPLLLTVMAYVHYKQVGLPERRVQLYEQCVRVMLDNWEAARRGQSGGGLSDQLGLPALRDETAKLLLLCPIAWHMQAHGLPDVTRADVEPLILPTFKSLVADESHARDKVFEFLEFLVGRSGLLQEKDVAHYSFPHRTFQEYLTALWLVHRGDWPETCFAHRADPVWREVILLTVARLAVTQQGRAALDLIRRLVEETRGDDRYRGLALAGECLRDVQKAVVAGLPGGLALWDVVRHGLAELCEGSATEVATTVVTTGLSMPERAEAGRVLGWLGDPRLDVACDVPYLIEIPAGEFVMGSDTSESERPQHKVTLPTYLIGKHPVTNAQYRRFVVDGGYTEKWRRCWTGAGWKWRGESDVSEPRFGTDPRWNIDNHPVAGVSWYEAVAYCNWLKATTGRDFGLPSEAEWEKAARGPHGFEWPWGNAFEAGEANTWESDIGQTTAVGLFPRDQSPYGLQDCAGNVWEWTRSLWGEAWQQPDFKYPYDPEDSRREDPGAPGDVLRVLRGGAWNNAASYARCAYRSRGTPVNRSSESGFRCVLRSP